MINKGISSFVHICASALFAANGLSVELEGRWLWNESKNITNRSPRVLMAILKVLATFGLKSQDQKSDPRKYPDASKVPDTSEDPDTGCIRIQQNRN